MTDPQFSSDDSTPEQPSRSRRRKRRKQTDSASLTTPAQQPLECSRQRRASNQKSDDSVIHLSEMENHRVLIKPCASVGLDPYRKRIAIVLSDTDQPDDFDQPMTDEPDKHAILLDIKSSIELITLLQVALRTLAQLPV